MFDTKNWETNGPIKTGQALARTYVEFEQRGRPSIPEIIIAFADHVGLEKSHNLRPAAKALGEAAELSGLANGYHNPFHTFQVDYNTALLLSFNQHLAEKNVPGAVVLSPEQMVTTMVAAVGHDLGHDGKTNHKFGADGTPQLDADGKLIRVPSRLEQIAVDRTGAILRKNGVADDIVQNVAAIIYGTEPTESTNAVKQAYLYITGLGAGAPPVVPEKLSPLLENRELAVMANIVGSADVLGSVLTPEYEKRMSGKLSKEHRREMGPADTLGFLKFVIGEDGFAGPVGGFFNPNIRLLRKTAEAELAPSAPPGPHSAATATARGVRPRA